MNFLEKLKAVFKTNVSDTSETGKVDSTDFAKIGRNAMFVGIAAGLTEMINTMSPDVLGHYTPFVVLGLTALLDFITKLLKNNKES